MSLPTIVGFRYLRAKKGSRFLSLISGFSILGVAIGVATLIVVLSVMDGFEGALRNRLAKGEFHVLVSPDADSESPYFPLKVEKIAEIFAADARIQAVNPVLKTEAILRAGKRVSGVSVRGILEAHMNAIAPSLIEADLDTENETTAQPGLNKTAAEKIPSPSESRQRIVSNNGIWLGKELAYHLNVLPGEKVTIISPTETEGPLESVPRMRTFVVEAIFESGIPEKDLHVIYAPIAAVREYVGAGDVVNQVEVQTKNFQESPEVALALKRVFSSGFLVRDWKQLNAHLFASLQLERITMFVILTMIIVVASFNIITSLTMLVAEKRKDIAILRAMGATGKQVGRIFLVQGAVIGNIGTFLGLVLGLGICLALQNYPIIELPDVFYDRSLPVKITPFFIVGIVITSVLIVLTAAWFPARAASRLTPLEGFREG